MSLANTREVLYLVNRSGNAPSHPAAEWIDKAIDLVSPHAPRVCLRGDTDFSLTANFDAWPSGRLRLRHGQLHHSPLPAEALDESSWARLERPPPTRTRPAGAARRRTPRRRSWPSGYLNLQLGHEDVAEFDYQPGK